MRRYSSRTELGTLTELNITPLLDLAFVLLIIFMITTPLLENSIDLAVPSSSTARTSVNPGEIQMISIDRNSVTKLNEVPLTLGQLERRLGELKAENPEMAVAVRAHKDLAIQRLIEVMDILQRTNVKKVGIMARQEDGAAP